jgi:hypothetical protein
MAAQSFLGLATLADWLVGSHIQVVTVEVVDLLMVLVYHIHQLLAVVVDSVCLHPAAVFLDR